MAKKLNAASRVMYPTNVTILHKSTRGTLLNEYHIKNMVLKEYGLYSWIRFILGDFYNKNILDSGQYIPKYLGVGTNSAPLTGAPGTETAVKVTDTSLFHEIFATGLDTIRIPLNRANYIEDISSSNYLKIQYEAYIPEDLFVGETIGEFALMTQKTGWNAFARISGFEPFEKVPNSVIQVIWEISVVSIESSTRFVPPIKTYLEEAIEKAIDVLRTYTTDPTDPDTQTEISGARVALENLILPASSTNTGLYYLLNENEQITQTVINDFLSDQFEDVDHTGLIPLINKFDPSWQPSGNIIE